MTELYTPPEFSAPGLVPYINALGTDLIGCELGVCRGYNLRYILDRAPNVKMSYAIDPWAAYQDWCGFVSQETVNSWKDIAMTMIEANRDRVTLLEMNSTDATAYIPNNSLDYIFIDGDHSYQATLTDCQQYWNKVKSGGIFAGHDHQLPDVAKAVADFRAQNQISTQVQFTESNVWFWYKT